MKPWCGTQQIITYVVVKKGGKKKENKGNHHDASIATATVDEKAEGMLNSGEIKLLTYS